MATPIKKNGKWKASVCVNYRRKSKTFATRAEAVAWTRTMQVKGVPSTKHTLHQALDRYQREVTPTHKGDYVESCIIQFIKDDPISAIPLGNLSSRHIAQWRDRLAETLAPDTILRRKNVLSQVLNTAIRDWEWCEDNPIKSVQWPKAGPSRERTLTDAEIDLFIQNCDNYEMIQVVRFALETAMRRSEILAIRPHLVEGRVVTLPDSKNGLPRPVPLSSTALEILDDVGYRFSLKPKYITNKFGKVCQKAGIKDARFHDLRHTAITRLAKIIDNPMTLAKISGHKDLKVLMNYYNPKADEIAAMLG